LAVPFFSDSILILDGKLFHILLGDDNVTLVRIPFHIFIAVGILAFHFSVELGDIKGMCLWENWILKTTPYEKCVEEVSHERSNRGRRR
jgi:hypothetical protein